MMEQQFMDQALLLALGRWSNFYVIVGSSAGALTGLQFVVITLVAQSQAASSMREIRAFGTPTIVHFGAALVISVLMNVPWFGVSSLAASIGALAVIGFLYSLTVIVHARKQTGYNPDTEDWFWYTALPLLTYLTAGVAAILTWRNTALSLYLIAAISVVFLLMGIRNSWDTVTYVAVQRRANGAQ